MMKRQIWLYSLIERMMEDAGSPLRVTFDWLCQTVHSDSGVIYLRESNPEEERCVCFTDRKARCVPSAEADSDLLASARNACENRNAQDQDGIFSLPLSCEEADAFGAIAFLHGKAEDAKRLNEALSAFSKYVYGELMSGFLESDAPVVLRGENICMNYSADRSLPNAVNHVSFSIRKGQFTVIMGRSGSGKSSLLNIIGGMLTPTEGKLWWKDRDIAGFSRREKTAYRRDTLGFIFQNYNLISDLTALENVEVAVSLAKKADSAEEYLKQVGLENKMSSYPAQMSGGEQQRISVARALVKRPEILLCDEPTGALDTVNARNIMILLQGIAHQRDIAVIMVTHNPEFIPLSDHYIEMENGIIKTDIYQPFPYLAEDKL